MNQPSQNLSAQSAVEIPSLSVVSEYDRLLDLYAVTCFAVLDPRIDGKTQHHLPISPWFATRAQAAQCKAQKQADFPACYIATVESYFTSECEAGRLELLTQIIGVDQGDLSHVGEFDVCSFIVVQGGEDGPNEYAPISHYFPSKEQARAFQALSRTNYPECRILTQVYEANDEPCRQRLIASLFREQAPGVPQQLADNILFLTITCFAVVQGDTAGRQHLPIGPYFRTKAEAERFQAEIRAQYPQCRIAQHSFVPEDEAHRQELLESLLGKAGAE
jgi:hypothetical protein